MKVYTIKHGQVTRGALLNGEHKMLGQYPALELGGGTNTVRVRMFRKNPAEFDRGRSWGGDLMEAHPVRIRDGFTLAKPHRQGEQILVVIKTRNLMCNRGSQVGTWSFDPRTTPTFRAVDQILVTATGPIDYFANQHDLDNIGWHDALVVMNVGDIVQATDQDGQVVIAKYESVESGLVKQ